MVNFRKGWKHLCSLYRSNEENGCLIHGSSKETLAYWANEHHTNHLSRYESPRFYREVLREAVKRGYAIESRSASGCRKYKFNC